jgi:hypothetical protein
MKFRLVGLLSVCVLAFGCGSDDGGGSTVGPCELDNPPPECSQGCDAANPCPAGFYCAADGTCNADCAIGTTNCGGEEVCTDDGQCIPPDELPDGGPIVGVTECNDGIDNDGDGLVDGADPECTGSVDNDEGSFATGIPGDNIDAVKQDCFFDGDSGQGNDGCDIHVCCLLSPGDAAGCPEDLKPGMYDPNDCEQTQMCKDVCGALTPPGCDCFGCCSVCNDDGCFDILINPNISPNCTAEEAGNPDVCAQCTQNADCGPGSDDCVSLECQLCPGEVLPEECMGMQECPNGLQTCIDTADCGAAGFCSNGCCIAIVE